GQEMLTVTGTTRLVTVKLGVADQRLAKKGAKVQAALPDGRSVNGTISKVETVIEAGSGQGGDNDPTTKIEVSIAVGGKDASAADQAAVAAFDSASVSVTFTAAERKDVLTVPVSALVALLEG